ncbi:hypothetical protein DRN77_03175 [Methanosarcinales archaeon]|nr:MAG: hypothetical protein DRN77_03175 [Methanosarcinales archaeon]
MVLRKHIALEDEHLKKLEPLLEKHKGNLSAAIRDAIDLTDVALQYYGSVKDATYLIATLREIREDQAIVPKPIFDYLLSQTKDLVIEKDVLDHVFDPSVITTISEFEEAMRNLCTGLYWDAMISINPDEDQRPSTVHVEIKGVGYDKRMFLAGIIGSYLTSSALGITSMHSHLDMLAIDFERRTSSDVAYNDLLKNIGTMQTAVKELNAKPEFWRSLIHEYSAANYEIVALHRKFYEELLIGKIPRAIMTSECLCEKLSEDVPMQEVLLDLKRVAETSRIVNRMDIDGEDITIHHGYRNMRAVEQLKNIILCMLESAGLDYDHQLTSNVITLKHRPEVEAKIRELLEYVGVKDIFDEPLREFSLFLKERGINADRHTRVFGRRIGRRVVHNYEKQYGEAWTADKFRDALAGIDKIPGRESKWDAMGSTVHYTVLKCPLADNVEACHVCRGIFRGAMHCAFRGMAELEVRKLLSHGDEYCEVYVHGIG